MGICAKFKFHPHIYRAVEESFMPYFLEPYIFSPDGFQRKAILILTNIMALHKGRMVAVNALKFCLNHADESEHIGTTLMLIKDNEAWWIAFESDELRKEFHKTKITYHWSKI